MKKTLMTITATALIATSFGFSPYVEAATATKQAISIKETYPNGISSKLVATNNKQDAKSTASIASANTYSVKAGDTLWGISKKTGVSVTNLKKINSLSSDVIRIGQVLKLTSDSDKEEIVQLAADVDKDVTNLINEATKLVGTKYVFGGSSPSGFDCSGFIYYVLNKSGKDVERKSSLSYYKQSTKLDKPEKGDFVFFAGTYKPGISHMGIYIGNNSFVHASSDGVQISSLSNSYWSEHFYSYGRFKD
ncbi:C40 family peptidase [Aquibacillus salsiterrae]|uniref:NlpC/P60 family protein n=1 Tax=Aquibacillus salsiterrae TaxID=2950439 RepID=A0A9X3WEK1_9BACI|nr:C40 family peptidase [Aquibacillus salsiterrae]MDC3415979.1 NlpC/P60 family protein [Aquibacillus salsiterrae]